jgi:hypothetical protein
MTKDEAAAEVRRKMYEKVTGAYKEGFEKKDKKPKKPEEKFILPKDEESSDTEAIMYSDIFPGAKAYLAASGKEDINIAKMYHQVTDWDEDDQLQIPKYDTDYVWQHEIVHTFLLATLGGMKILTVGDTGTGKTTFHKNVAALMNQPFYRLSGRGDMESDSIFGRVDIQDGSTNYLLGEFPKAFKSGYYCLFDEQWKLPAPINMTLQRVLELSSVCWSVMVSSRLMRCRGH